MASGIITSIGRYIYEHRWRNFDNVITVQTLSIKNKINIKIYD